MARSYEFSRGLKNADISRTVKNMTKGSGFTVRYFPDRVVATDGATEYRITSSEISETGQPNPLYEGLRNALKSAAGVTHG